MSAELLTGLQNSTLFPHSTKGFRMLETHISWVLLTGDYVYKIKKPMNFGFLDFTTLEKRKFYCDEEIRLNKRLAPDLYLETVAIYGSPANPGFNGDAAPMEYAVKMRQFDPDSVLTINQPGQDELQEILTEVMIKVARFHESDCARARMDQPFGSAGAVLAPVTQNFEQIGAMLTDAADQQMLQDIKAWALGEHKHLAHLLDERKRDGKVRECHGDMHLGNIAVVNGKAVLFDCIEFNEEFRWIDVINDVAFLLMDLDDRGLPGLACQLLNTYLEETGDYESVSLLSFYKSYRAMVRCKVALFTMASPGMDAAARTELASKVRSYLQLALSYTKPSRPFLCLTQGLSGSGKTTLSSQLMLRQPCIRVRSDVERKRLAGLTPLANSGSQQDAGIYAPEISQLTYQRLLDLATMLLQAGHSVIVDATFLKVAHRQPFIELARNTSTPLAIAACSVAESTAKQWLAHRSSEGKDAAEADYDIMLKQKDSLEEFTREESLFVIHVHMDHPAHLSAQLTTLANVLLK